MEGYTKIQKKILDWEWYTDVSTCKLFFHILLKCNYKEYKWRGKMIKPGEFITSLEHLSIETGLTKQQVRTAIEKLKRTGEITHRATNDYTILRLNNWESYNIQDNTPDNKRSTNDQQTINKRITTTKKEYKDNKEKNKTEVFSNVFLTEDEIDSLQKKFGPLYQKGIERLSNYKNSTGKSYKSDFHALNGWVYDAVLKNSQSPGIPRNAITGPKVYTLPTNKGSSSQTTTIEK